MLSRDRQQMDLFRVARRDWLQHNTRLAGGGEIIPQPSTLQPPIIRPPQHIG
jgi:hypothetical protein